MLHGSIGDVTRALPLATLLHRGFPRATLSWSVEPACFPLVDNYPGLDEIIVFDRRWWWKDVLPFLRNIRSRRFDLVVDLQRHLKSGIISRWTGARVRIGFNRSDSKEFNWLFNNHHIPACGDAISKLDHYLKFAEYIGVPLHPIEWHFKLNEFEQSGVEKHLAAVASPFAVLFVGSRWESKRWFPAQIAECSVRMRERHHLDVVLLGGREDRNIAAEAVEKAGIAIQNLVGQTSLREVIGIIARAKLAVGPDTGLMHIAAAMGTPVISLWGATSPRRTGPYNFQNLVIQGRAACVPCYSRRCSIGRICMRSIDPETIAAKIEWVLAHVEVAEASHVGSS